MTPSEDGLFSALRQRGMSRRAFLAFCAATAGALAIPVAYAPRIAAALSSAPRIPVIWLRGQGCGGDGEALFRASSPSVAELILQVVSLDYAEWMMASSGTSAGQAVVNAMASWPDRYFAVVEGAVPMADDGVYALSGGRPFRDVVREVCDGALATIAVGSCAFDGGLSAAAGGRTGAVGVGSVVGTDRLVNLPGCPVNAGNLTATLVHYLTFNELPARDMRGRPLFAYGGLVHNQCERRSHFEYGEFVLAWGDEGAQKGWCLYKMGCKGPETFANCPTLRYGEGASWPVKAGHGCIGCTMPAFWDAMSPFYLRLPSPLPFAQDVTVDQIGGAAFAGVAALTAAHATATYARHRVRAARERRRARQALPGPAPRETAPPTAPESMDHVDAEQAGVAEPARPPVDTRCDSGAEPEPEPGAEPGADSGPEPGAEPKPQSERPGATAPSPTEGPAEAPDPPVAVATEPPGLTARAAGDADSEPDA